MAALNPHNLRRLSVEAGADPRTVTRFLAGDPARPVTSTTAARIAAAIVRLGLDVKPATPTTPGERYVEIDPEAVVAETAQ
jgi:hypothetical protein